MMITVFIMAQCLWLGLGLKSGSTFEMDCPGNNNYSAHSLRTYAIVMTNAQRNIQIDLTFQSQNE